MDFDLKVIALDHSVRIAVEDFELHAVRAAGAGFVQMGERGLVTDAQSEAGVPEREIGVGGNGEAGGEMEIRGIEI